MIKTQKLFFAVIICTVAVRNFQVTAKPIDHDLDSSQISANNEPEHSGIKKRDVFDWIFSYFTLYEDDDTSDSYFDDSDEETYLICRNCTVVINKENDGITAPAIGSISPGSQAPPIILEPTPMPSRPLVTNAAPVTSFAPPASITTPAPIATPAPITTAAPPVVTAAPAATTVAETAATTQAVTTAAATPAAAAPAADAATTAAPAAASGAGT